MNKFSGQNRSGEHNGRSVFAVLSAELGDTIVSFAKLFLRLGEYNTEVVVSAKYGPGQDRDSLFPNQLPREVDLRLESREPLDINLHHNVHRRPRLDRLQPGDPRKSLVGDVRVVPQGSDQVLVPLFGCVRQEGRDGGLNNRAGPQNEGCELQEARADLLHDTLAVVDRDPAKAVSGDHVLLRESTHGEDGDTVGNVGCRDELPVVEHHIGVDLVRDDREAELLSEGYDGLHVLAGEVRPAWVTRVVDEDSARAVVNLCAEVRQVALPPILRAEIVETGVVPLGVTNRLVQREPRSRQQNVVPGVQHRIERELNRVARATRHENVIPADGVLRVPGETLGDRRAALRVSRAGGVSVELRRFDVGAERLDRFRRREQVSVRAGVADGQGNTLLVSLRLDHQLVHDLPDRVGGLRRRTRHHNWGPVRSPRLLRRPVGTAAALLRHRPSTLPRPLWAFTEINKVQKL
eukprot:Hpha_TRINITY_DN10714_c0_g1::TRINITY_DN10714_c0_g1_i1::g.43375::m.43375